MSDCRILHADLDAFYASVEALDHPQLRGKALVVGGTEGKRGVVSACSYEARASGVHSAMPMGQARRLCPDAVFLPVRMARYQELSQGVMQIFSRFSPEVRQISIDEAFLDVSGTERLFGPAEELARRLRATVRGELGLSLTVGMASNRYLAKLASAAAKPDGFLHVQDSDALSFIDRRGLERLWGLGPKTLERLKNLGIRSTGDLRAMEGERLSTLLGPALADFLSEAVNGRDPGIFADETKSSSLSIERTFPVDISSIDILETVLLELADELAWRLHLEKKEGRTLALKLRHDDFSSHSIRETRERIFSSADEMWHCARGLLARKLPRGQALRLMGLSMQQVTKSGESAVQGELFANEQAPKERIEEAVRALREKHGLAVTRARLLKRPPDAP